MVKFKSIFKIQNLNQNALNIQSWSRKDGLHVNKFGVSLRRRADNGLPLKMSHIHISMSDHQNIEVQRI